MLDPTTVADAYIALWNQPDRTRRREMLAQGWAADARYADPILRGAGADEIDALIGGVQARFPGFAFALRGEPSGHGEFVRFSWKLGPTGAQAPIEGGDVLVMEGDRIAQVIGFLDKVP